MAKRKGAKGPSTKHTHKSKDRITQTQLIGGYRWWFGRYAVPSPLVTPVVLI